MLRSTVSGLRATVPWWRAGSLLMWWAVTCRRSGPALVHVVRAGQAMRG
ncbi:hypothetical protein ACWIID_18180 [Streptomyces phaeochromogenes]